jgi:hypothetical protein
MYDLNIVPISQLEGEQKSGRTGFYAASPPRRAARSRSEDLLILYLNLGDDRVSDDVRQSWLEKLAEDFYKTSGSVTSALRSLVETLNQTIMDRNLKYPGASGALTAAVNAIALHGRQAYITQSGLVHVYSLTKQGLEHYYDASQADRGLGVSRTPTIRYFHTELGDEGYLLMTKSPPDTWTEGRLMSSGLPNLEQLKRRLLDQAPSSLTLELVQIKLGSGQIKREKSMPIIDQVVEEVTETPLEQPAFEGINLPEEEADTVAEGITEDTQKLTKEELEVSDQGDESFDLPVDVPEESDIDFEIADEATESEVIVEEVSKEEEVPAIEVPEKPINKEKDRVSETIKRREKQLRQAQVREKSLKGLVAFFDRWRNLRDGVNNFFLDLAARWSSDDREGPPKISTKTLLLIAVIVPLVLVVIASSVYVIRGRRLQYDSYYELAEAKAASASIASDSQVARSEWLEAMNYIEQAESYKETEETALLKAQAQTALDRLDGALRLRYHSAIIGSLPTETKITRIISYGVDLYLLDATTGSVIHALGTGNGYEIDQEFICQAGNFSGGSVDKLVDMVSMPPNNTFQAHVLGIDAGGNVIYCAPEQNPIVQSLPFAGGNLAGVTKIAYESNTLYVLSPGMGTVYVYQPTNGQYLEPPDDYFEGWALDTKPDLTQITDLDVNGPKLYFLRADGLMAECEVSGCKNPVTYLDTRSGGEVPIESLPGSDYVSVIYNAPPDSTISILDSVTGDIYQFSLSFRLSKRLRPDMGNNALSSTTASAFTIAMDRVVFIAFGNQVFFAYID